MSGIPQGFKPNLAATLTKPELIKFPVWASPKIDGIRCVIFGGVAYSRSLKPIPNEFVQAFVAKYADVLQRFDGELVVGDHTDPNCMQKSMAVMRASGKPNFVFHVFDEVPISREFGPHYIDRMQSVADRLLNAVLLGDEFGARVSAVTQFIPHDQASMDSVETYFLEQGYEGMMIRNPHTLYKCGRSTEREGGLVKVKRFVDGEAVIVGFEEEMHNANEATRNATSRTERSTAQAGLIGKGSLGSFVVRDSSGRVFNIGTGYTAAQRRDYWHDRDSFVGRVVKFKHFDHGTVDAPRHPVFIGFRHPEDM
ncbi:PBCV-1 DNA ligase [Burkholderia pseudomallei]|nr:PBCV-1 DNA ligase [Burkholderia pseudomallei]CAJ3805634.1 PBCV-1 DNA ligase [Burkholderia pseudomallei]CAJ4080309.1 PBCV-1 DNA ligase [Burkholderia pseudomallei]CAJ6088287.1 PBCV-1 DNA ligase [Burkholderia pseudomallei]CAJ8649541.1 PBCV-1 DNA ligase [Burkholderia pseudomallei]